LGVDAIEIDVHCTRDGVPVLLHDETLDRTTDGHGPVAERTLAQLQALDAGGDAFAGRFRGERVPALADVLDLTRTTCLLVVEIKQRGIEQAVADVIRRANAAGSVMLWSFHAEVVSAARAICPEAPAARLAGMIGGDAAVTLLNDTVRRNAQAVSVFGASLSPSLVRAARLRGLGVFTWTVDVPAEQARVATAGVDGIVTNLPDVLRATLQTGGFGGIAGPRRDVRTNAT
jgi:glycerophosphoryl diester phosphodiesterase